MWTWKLTWFLWWWSKLSWSQCGGPNLNWFQCRGKIDLIVVWVVELTWYLYADQESLVYRISTKIDLVFCGWSKLTWFQCEGSSFTRFQCRYEIDFVVRVVKRVGIDLAFVYRSKTTCSKGRIERNWVLVSGHRNRPDIWVGIKLTWLQWWGRNSLVYHLRERNWLGFSVGIKLDFLFVRASKSIWFVCGPRNSWF